MRKYKNKIPKSGPTVIIGANVSGDLIFKIGDVFVRNMIIK